MNSFEHNPVPCRACGRDLEAAHPVDGGLGQLHDAYSVCIFCGEVSIFIVKDDMVTLREPTIAELDVFQRHFGPFIRTFNSLQHAGSPRPDQETPE